MLRETKDGILQPFNKDKAETEVENWIKKLPVNYLEDLRSCVKDFFSGIGKQQTGSALLQGEKKRNGIASERRVADPKWRPAKLNVIADYTEDYARELEQRRLIEEQEKMQNCYNQTFAKLQQYQDIKTFTPSKYSLNLSTKKYFILSYLSFKIILYSQKISRKFQQFHF